MNSYWPLRSKLFVPGARPGLFSKALASDADGISIDLQDAVIEERKSDARTATERFLMSAELNACSKIVIVRVNAFDHPNFSEDLRAVTHPRLDILNLPMLESADTVRSVAALLDRFEHQVGLDRPVNILANIETAKGLRQALEIATASPRVVGMQIGYADLFEGAGIDRYDIATVRQILLSLRLSAAEAGVWVCDGAYPDISNLDGFREEAQLARRLGYVGKSCIHPRQIAVANAVFSPTREQIAQAERIVAAAAQAERDGLGAFILDGRMIDAPFVRRAAAVLQAASPGTKLRQSAP